MTKEESFETLKFYMQSFDLWEGKKVSDLAARLMDIAEVSGLTKDQRFVILLSSEILETSRCEISIIGKTRQN